MRRLLFVIGVLWWMTAPSWAQTVMNPKNVDWTVSANHADTLPDGSAMISRYEIRFYASGATAPVSTSTLGKPTPDATGKATADLAALIVAFPLDPKIVYTARIVAIGPTGTSAESPNSNPFVRAGPPAAVPSVVVR